MYENIKHKMLRLERHISDSPMNTFQVRNCFFKRIRDDNSSAYEPKICMDSNSLVSDQITSGDNSLKASNKNSGFNNSGTK